MYEYHLLIGEENDLIYGNSLLLHVAQLNLLPNSTI